MSNQAPAKPCLSALKSSDLPPSQQLALLTLLSRHDLAKAVVVKLKASTVRCSIADYRALIAMGLAERTPSAVYHQATPDGVIAGVGLARELAQALNVRPIFTGVGSRRRSFFRPGGFSQAGNW